MATARILLRVSTDKQAKAASVGSQRGPVRALAERCGATKIVEYVEEAVSGAAPLDERDVLLRLLAEAEPGDLVGAFDLSRLTRSDDWEDRYRVLGRLRKANVRPVTVEDGEIDLHSIGGRITLHVRAEGAADERKRIRSRLDAGKANAADRGQKPQGQTPYGLAYNRDERAWGLHEERAAIVRDLFRRADEGETCGQLAARCTAAGHLTPRGRSTAWTARMVWQLLSRRTYIGEWTFAGRTIAVPAIVDAALWNRVQARFMAAQRRGLRRTQRVYLLDEGTGRCGACGGPLRVRWGGTDGVTSYYLCPDRACAQRWRRTSDADAEVWGRIRDALRRPDLVERALQGHAEAAGDLEAGESDAAGFERQIERLDGVEAAILARFRRGVISETAMDREAETIARERRLLQQSAQAAREAAAVARASVSALRGLREAASLIAAHMDAADAAERREIVRLIRPDVRADRDAIRISFRLRAPSPSTASPKIAIVSASCSCTENHCDPDPSDGDGLEIAVVA